MKSPETAILCDKLVVGYRKARIIYEVCSNISFSANQGELVALIGANGTGKSTLLRTIVKIQPELKGACYLFGQNLADIPMSEIALQVSFVSTEPVRTDRLNVEELVALGRLPHTNWFGKLEKNDIEIACQAIENTGLKKLAGKYINELSDGERQRAMIARALAQDTPVVVLDEPTAFLDISNKHEIIHLLQVLAHKHRKTIIFSTHDLSAAISHSDKIWLMRPDYLVQGAPEDLLLSGAFAQLFPHLGFDEQTASYKVLQESKGQLFVSGNNPLKLKWAARALERIGIQPVFEGNHESGLFIDDYSVDKNYNLIHAGEESSFQSLYDLILFLRIESTNNQ
jgi:iron complex transport system ATP-binding protein